MEWISVEDRLPEFHEPLLFFADDKNGAMLGMFYRNSHKFISYGRYTESTYYKADVTHWMPLPEPPKD